MNRFRTIVLVITSAAITFLPHLAHAQREITDLPSIWEMLGMGMTEIFGAVLKSIMGLFAMLVGWAGVLLNHAVYFTVLQMGHVVNDFSAIGVVWSIMRDIGNIVLIFGFIAVGICVILGVNWYGGGTKMLPMLLLAAIFINFSLFISEAVIDVGNLFATQFYVQMNGGVVSDTILEFSANNGEMISKSGISFIFMKSLGIQKIYDLTAALDTAGKLTGSSQNFIYFLAIILFLITAFVFFSLAFILIARFVVLIFLIMLAPIGFAGLAVPKLEGYAKMWWQQLFKQTFTAPILFLMLYIALSVITDRNFLSGFYTSADGHLKIATNPTPQNVTGFAGILLSFAVAMGLLLACTYLAKQMGAAGANFATKWGSRLSGVALVAGGVGLLGRSTVGAAGYGVGKWVRTTPIGRTFVGRGIAGALEKRVGGATFDVRNTGLAKATGAFGFDIGKGQHGGYAESRKQKEEAYKKIGADMKGKPYTQQEEKDLAQAKTYTKDAKEKEVKAKEAQEEAENTHKAEKNNLNDQKKKVTELDDERKTDPTIVAATKAIETAATALAQIEEDIKKNGSNLTKEGNLSAAKTTLINAKADLSTSEGRWEANPNNLSRRQAINQAVSDGKSQFATAEKALADANNEFAKAVELRTTRVKEETKIIKEIVSEEDRTKEAQQDYADRLKKWGRYTWNGAATEAAKRVKKDAGKTSEEREIEAFMSKVRKAAAKEKPEEKKEEAE